METLAGKQALVTGAAVRVGRAIAWRLAEAGADLAVHCRSHVDEAEDLCGRVEALGRRTLLLRGDLRDQGTIRAMFDQVATAWGGLDVLVNSASVFHRTPLDAVTDEDWALHLDVNLTAPWRCVQAALPLLRGRGGRIVNLVDLSALAPWPSYIPHSVSKAGLLAMTRGLARALAREGIAVNAVAPGAVLFPDDASEEERARVLASVPAGRAGTPNDVAEAVLYLCGASPFVTGTLITVDGGQSLRCSRS
ncbi:MAG: glucose 1-dehydrogenase [Myxococcales bacterium]